MGDVTAIAPAESAIGYFEESWGRSVAWALALTKIVLPIAIITVAIGRQGPPTSSCGRLIVSRDRRRRTLIVWRDIIGGSFFMRADCPDLFERIL